MTVRPVVVAHYLGLLIALLGAIMLFPFLVSLVYQEGDELPLLASALIHMVAGGGMWFLTREQPGPMERKESFMVVGLGWLLASAFGAIPYMLAGTFTSYIDAYFETMSGFTTTGSSVMADIEIHPHGILLWRDLTQWLGGMGIIALFVALLPLTRIGAAGASALMEDETPAPQADRVTPRIRDTAKALWVIYMAMTVVLILLLLLAGMPWFDAVANAFGTMATGGFSPKNASIAYFNSGLIDWIITVFMALAGVNFGLYYLIWRRKLGAALSDSELRAYFAILAGVSLLVAVDLMANRGYTSLLEAIRFSTFQVVSQQTTTGFVTADFDTWTWFSKSLILMVMFIGASSGSTGGAFKVVRLVVVAKFASRQILTTFRPRVVSPLMLNGRVISDNMIRECVGFLIVYQSIFVFSTVAVIALGLDFMSGVSGVAATLGNVGPGFNLVGPTRNFSTMPDLVKVIFTFDMYVGRLELWTALILLRPSFWREP